MPRSVLGGLLIALLVPTAAVAQPSPGDVVVNEIMYAPSPPTNEFIELYNRSGTAIALDELAFADANRAYEPVTTTDTMLASGDYVVLVRSPEEFKTAFPSVAFLAPGDWAAYNNGGDTVFLRHTPSETVIDSVPYDPSWGGNDGRSLARIDPAGPSDMARNFATSVADAGATPGRQNSVFDPDVTPPTLVTAGPSRDGDSLTVVFSEPVAPSTVSADAFQLENTNTPSITAAQVSASAPRRVHCALTSSLPTGNFTLVVSGVADPRGNVLDDAETTFSYVVPETPAPKDVVVSEIQYAPPMGATEFVEVLNRSDKTIDLGALQIADVDRDFKVIAPPLTPLEPGEYAVVVRDPEAFEATFPDVNYFSPDGWDALNNGGDTVILRYAPSATDLDAVPYTPAWGGSEGRSLERIDPRGPSDRASNFASSTAPAGATPGARNSRFARDTLPPQPTFAEQTDSLRATVVFDEPVQPASVVPGAFEFEEATATGATLQTDSIARLSLSEAPTAASVNVTGVRDLVGNRLDEATLPFARRPSPGVLVINELMFDPLADDFDDQPNQVEYVELHNLAEYPVTLNGLTLTDRPTEDGVADTLRAGRQRAVLGGGFAVVAAAPDGDPSVQQSQLAAAFPTAPLTSDSVAYLPVDANQLGLRNDGDRVRVHRRDQTVVSAVTYVPDWHTSSLTDPKGTALERISPTGGPNASDNWTSSPAATGGTPGAPNAVSLAPPAGAPEAPALQIRPSPFSIERDGATRIRFTLRDAPSLVRVRLYDPRGRRVRTLEKAQLVGRSGELVWNGRNDAGERVRIGPYVVLLEAVRTKGGTVTRLQETVVVARPLN